MDLYDILKLVHISAMIVWIGTGLGLLVLNAAAQATHDDQHNLRVIKGATILGPTLSVPSSLLLLLSGLGLVWAGGHGWEAWVLLSLIGVAVVLALGAFVVGPMLERATLVWERDDDVAQALDLGHRAMRVARLDQVIQFAVLALMVLRPGWDDGALLAGLGVLAALAALRVLRPAPREGIAA